MLANEDYQIPLLSTPAKLTTETKIHVADGEEIEIPMAKIAEMYHEQEARLVDTEQKYAFIIMSLIFIALTLAVMTTWMWDVNKTLCTLVFEYEQYHNPSVLVPC